MNAQSTSKKTTAALNKSITALVKQSVPAKKELGYAVQHISGEGPRHKLLQNEWLFD